MSNYTTFFPAATGGGSTEITDPDKIPKVTAGSFSTSYVGEQFYTLSFNGTAYDGDSTSGNSYFGVDNTYLTNSGGQVLQTSDNTEITLANVTSGSGYLCCVVTPVGNLGSTQEIKITIDGGTEKVYTFDYDSNTSSDNYYTRLVYGFSAWGSPDNTNIPSQKPIGIGGLGGAAITFGDHTYPPIISAGAPSYLRLFTAHEFKNYGLPKLRFDSSLLVKCKTNGLYSSSGQNAKAIAVYYLDSQL
tara:strand:+ start:1835 stop:2569 length:735 start_codon:yes stop_codon:yes gene_type:complete